MKQVLRNKDKGNFLERYLKSFCHAIDGIIYAILYEHNLIIIILAMIITTLAGIYYKLSINEWLFIIFCFSSVSATEMINTAIEALVDLETTKIHPLAKIAKDTASSATLIFSIASFIGALLIFMPKIIGG